jgi:LacI family transcriptional regulator
MPNIPKVVLLMETSRACGRGMQLGISKYSRLHGPWTFYRIPLFYRELQKKKETISDLKDWGPDGIIMGDTFYPTKVQRAREIIKLGVPTIAIANEPNIPGVVNVVANNDQIGPMAADHLLGCGLKHFACCGFDDVFWSVERGESFAAAVAEAGFETHFYKQPKSRAKQLWKNEQLVMANWLKFLPKPVGLMVCNDDRGQQAIDACNIAGLNVPDDIAIIAVDNDELVCDLTDPTLSSVNLNFQRAGYESAELLDKLMAGKLKTMNRKIKVHPTHVVTRQSTDILAIDDPLVSAALRFIRRNAKKDIQISDVVEVVATSRRTLQQRFRKLMHRSLHDEIMRVRVKLVAQLLVETNLSVSEIMARLNYASPEHISRSFKKIKGLTPVAYRKEYGSR